MVMAIDLLYQTTVVLLQLYVSYVNLHLLRSQISIDYRDEFQSDIRVRAYTTHLYLSLMNTIYPRMAAVMPAERLLLLHGSTGKSN